MKSTRLAIFLLAWVLVGAALLDANPCWGAILFELPNIEVVGNSGSPTAGSFDVIVRALTEDLPQSVGSFNVHFGVDSTEVLFGLAATPDSIPLLTGGSGVLNFSPDGQTIQAAHDVFPAAATLADGRGLIRVPFEVTAGVSGVFTLKFLLFNALADGNGVPLGLDISDTGSITVSLAQPSLQGDFDEDGDVDGNDFLRWQRGDSPDSVSSSDLAEWVLHYGTVANSITTALVTVPEPSSLMLLLAACVTLLSRRPRAWLSI